MIKNERILNLTNAENWERTGHSEDALARLLHLVGEAVTDENIAQLATTFQSLLADKAVATFAAGELTTAGEFVWLSNGKAPFGDVMELLSRYFLVSGECVELTAALRDRQTAESIAEYRRNYQPPSDEQLHEMRAAFGEGAEVVNVITGHRTHL